MLGTYILDEQHQPVCCSGRQWTLWFSLTDRHVGLTEIGCLRISTVFLGIDHNFSNSGPPILFETMVFDDSSGENDLCSMRCATWDEALLMHADAVGIATQRVRKADAMIGDFVLKNN